MSRDEQGIEAAAGLDAEELSLLGRLRSIQRKIRQYKWSRWKRLDPFVENLFERTDKGRFLLGRDVVLHDSTLVFGDVSIGEGSHVGQQVTLDGTGGLSIGRSCSIASGVRIQTHDSVRWALSGGKAAYEYAPVVIEDCCFIGANAVILKGVRVGAHSVVGAGAVVTRDVPAFSIAAGVPARVIGRVSLEDGKVDLSYLKKE